MSKILLLDGEGDEEPRKAELEDFICLVANPLWRPSIYNKLQTA